MSDLDAQFKQAVAEYKSGNKDKARDLLMEIVDKDEQHEQAWLYLSALVGTLEEQQICLENVLAINPNNARAKKGLDKVGQQIAARDAASAPPSPPLASLPGSPPASTPFSTLDWNAESAQPGDDLFSGSGTSAPIGAEFETASGDSLLSSAPGFGGFPSFDSFGMPDAEVSPPDDDSLDWMNTGGPDLSGFGAPSQPESDPFASVSGADWDQSGGTAAYDSGKPVDLPSEQEYDSWVQNLNIASDDIAEPPAFPDAPVPESGASLFGDTGYMIDDAIAAPEPGKSFFTDGNAMNSSSEWGSGSQQGFAGVGFGSVDALTDTDDEFGGFDQVDSKASFGAVSSYDGDGDAFDDDSAFGSPSPYADESELYVVGGEDESDEFDELDFSFDDDDDLAGEVAPPKSTAKKTKTKKAAAPDENARYFAQIPADIEAKTRGSRRGLMLVSILVMLGLNAASFAMFFLG